MGRITPTMIDDDDDVLVTRRRRNTVLLAIVSILLAVALLVVVSVIFTKRSAVADGADDAPTSACIAEGMRIIADPSVADALRAVVDDAQTADGCAALSVTEVDSVVTADSLAEGNAPEFDIWVPDSDMWPSYVTAQSKTTGATPVELAVGDIVASTPVVFAANEDVAEVLGSRDVGFSSLTRPDALDIKAALPDPTRISSSSAALLSLQTAVAGDARTFTGLILSRALGAPTTADALEIAATTGNIAVTTEQALRQHVEADGLVAIYPADVQPSLGIPLVTAAGASAGPLAAADAISAAMQTAGDRLADYDLRDAVGVDASSEDAAAITPMDSVNQAEVLRTWRVLTAPSRMLALSDVSGSMNQLVDGSQTRISLFEQAAVRAIHSLSDDSSMAVWAFSSRRIGAQDWQEVLPFGPLGDPEHKKRAIETASSLRTYVGGGTGLYDSVYAAVKYMKETYVPGEINLVLLNTDGYNEDDDGLDLRGLLEELEKLYDPATPVPVIAIGYGPDTDQDALEQIAAATEGAAYQALQPADITTVLVDAVTQRGCRPYCS
ncbi:substrate-binding domain-containing protein [uncultured Microbacterium sp.]|uniref:substrate-binding domain-containing protein n=1 Tax=uncultured Microbacterium sp. TaxID=191216 RepID=UPI00262218AB|nr:substrate-binding domain-containing protein [uncultured Microbacterium sp.]